MAFETATASQHSSDEQVNTPQDNQCDKSSIRKIVADFVGQLSMTISTMPYDHDFHEACCAEAARRKYTDETMKLLSPFFPAGVLLAITCFAHVDQDTKKYIVLYTALLLYLDDRFEDHFEAICAFQERYIRKESHGHNLLDALASILYEMPARFGQFRANIMTTSTLNMVTAFIMEHEISTMKLKAVGSGFGLFLRRMAGLAEAVMLFAFPTSIPWTTYIEALPEMAVFINSSNDLLSFYKEELEGDTTCLAHVLAESSNISKLEAIRRFGEESVESDRLTTKILEKGSEAYAAYEVFRFGYITFHFSLPRYKLLELMNSDDA